MSIEEYLTIDSCVKYQGFNYLLTKQN